jgi:hypothetical protein
MKISRKLRLKSDCPSLSRKILLNTLSEDLRDKKLKVTLHEDSLDFEKDISFPRSHYIYYFLSVFDQ